MKIQETLESDNSDADRCPLFMAPDSKSKKVKKNGVNDVENTVKKFYPPFLTLSAMGGFWAHISNALRGGNTEILDFFL